MMNATIDELIRLNVALEGSLRVLASRESSEAVESARQTLARLNNLFAEAFPEEGVPETGEEPPAAVKDEEAENGELSPEPEPTAEEVPQGGIIVESDAEATAGPSRDLRKAFTLNDKFLFRRELFGGSDSEFSDTIDLLSAMHSLDEAREYLFDDLQWDPKNEVVKDFMAIITNHFRS